MIVIEGMDNSGKSTLAKEISQAIGLPIQESEGPPLSRQEITDRIRRYSMTDNKIFVRHPCISNPIYDLVRPLSERGLVDQGLIYDFYRYSHLFIYCDPLDRGLDTHEVKEHDTMEHLQRITQGQATLLAGYRHWAVHHAHLMYRIGDDLDRILRMVTHEY